jgi:hypothetical protein
MGFLAGDCPPSKGDYVAKGFLSVLVQTFPFVGSAVDGYIPEPPNQQNHLNDLHSNLTANVDAWQKEITALTIENTTEINNLISTILGDPDNGVPGYADVVAMYYLEPVREQSTINSVNITFLAIMLSMVIWYILLTKKN